MVRCHRCEHITPVLMKLHWLPVKQRVQYSVLLLVFRAQHRLAPPYITDLPEQRATRVLRSTTNNDFYVPPSRSRYGDRMSSVAGPRLWNSLPAEMKKTCCLVTFKRLLKTHLFRAGRNITCLFICYLQYLFLYSYTYPPLVYSQVLIYTAD